MPNLIAAPRRDFRSWEVDSRRWEAYRPREGDIVISTYPKCGTTWTQRIVNMLVDGDTVPRVLTRSWLDARARPLDVVASALEAQTGRRVLKAHLPLDALPLYDGVSYITVARDGRDACMSYYNHRTSFTAARIAVWDRIGVEDPMIGTPWPRPPGDPVAFFREWLVGRPTGGAKAVVEVDFFDFQLSWWNERRRKNILMVHYNDLQADLAGEIDRIAAFLGIDVAPPLFGEIVEAAGFAAMRRDAPGLMPDYDGVFEGGTETFLHQGRNHRWREILTGEDVANYEARVAAALPPDCAAWVRDGRLVAGNPHLT